ncbi:Vps20 associated protein Vta1 [Schizosaccharomyces osmophilus]|uniref:Vps20 associated protein Vta1 n=1 Tax=Schizosaccharomyces osmophilus TaxID=2545709 RepID=A0AAE9WCE5_9SCHI|nr:Vps20 associated protein Vta1 [Schizosaccharomyces osmophilus]WBW73679.1 Vps20 associated protein Vta1 [Schizosaccharomyces osmophilus]
MSTIELETVPKEFSSIRNFVQRYNELSKYNPVIAYWCLYWAAQVGLSSSTGLTNTCRDFLLNLVERLEELRKELNENENVHDEESAKVYVNSFAMEVLLQAEEKSKQNTPDMLAYLAAKDFFDLLKVWGPLDEQTRKYLKFCKLRAVESSKRKSSTREGSADGKKDAPAPAPAPASASASEKTPASTQIDREMLTRESVKSPEVDFESLGLSTTMTGRPSSIAPLEQKALENEPRKNTQANAGKSFDLDELQDSLSRLTPREVDRQQEVERGGVSRGSLHVPSPGHARLPSEHASLTDQRSESLDDSTTAVSSSPSFPVSQMPSQSSIGSSTLPAMSSGTSVARNDLNDINHLDSIEAARGHARYAYSALDYDDTATAIFHLKSALGLLEP